MIYAFHAGVLTWEEGLSVLAVVIGVSATVATVYLWRVFAADRTRRRRLDPPVGPSWLLLMVAVACTALDALATWTSILAIRRLMGLEQLSWSPPISITLIVLVECVPIYIAFEFWRRRRRNGHPPPFNAQD